MRVQGPCSNHAARMLSLTPAWTVWGPPGCGWPAGAALSGVGMKVVTVSPTSQGRVRGLVLPGTPTFCPMKWDKLG